MTGDSEHIEVLRCGPRSWNEWRGENPSIVPNLVGLALSIGDRQMGPINGGPINLAHARLRHAFLRFATLTGADLVGADLADTDLREARL
ncbi:MAG: pentapeptide repeat-containing protein, partial [Phycisphaerae bacterium]|nr:pentapeptide repeat-containing protein [Phycisphaerae bacterium]